MPGARTRPDERDSETSDEVCLRISVRDTGIGVPEDKQRLIFAPFTQADASTTRRFGGSGLGLAIASELVAMMGGWIRVNSKPDEGAEFEFTARFRRADEGEPPAYASPAMSAPLRGLKALVVDDNPTNCKILEDALVAWNMPTTIATDAHAGLAELRQAVQQGLPYRIVVLDALMPDVDGFELARWIRDDERLRGTTIVMLSSADRSAFLRRCADLGISAYLEKPVARDDLLRALRQALQIDEASPRGAESDPPALTPARTLDVLVAEDTAANQKLVVNLLRRRGHRCHLAHNGKEAVDLAGQRKFDVVLMDVQMPQLDGLQATAMIRSRERKTAHRLPIVAMTAHAMRGDRERCLAAGMDAYISKPIDGPKLIELVESVAVDPGRDGQDSNGQVMMPNDSAPQPGDDSLERRIDRQFAPSLRRLGGSVEVFLDLAAFYREDWPMLLGELREAAERRDAVALERAAHSLKGLAANFDAAEAVELARRLEDAGRQGNLAPFDELAPRLSESLATLDDQLQQILAAR